MLLLISGASMACVTLDVTDAITITAALIAASILWAFFSSLARLRRVEKIKTLVMSHDDYNDSIIHYAARKKNPNVFGAVMSGIEKDINTQELETSLHQRGFEGRSLLSNAALQGDRSSIEAVLDAVRTRLTPDQVKTMTMSHDDFNNSILFNAARNKSPNVFGVVMSGIEKDISPQELETLLLQRGYQGRSLLSKAALHGNRTSFEAVLHAVRTRLTPDQVKTMAMSHDDYNDSIIFNAARNKSPNVFGAVISGIEKDITPQELETLLLQRGFEGRSLLSNAALHGDRTSFEAVLDAVRTRLTPDQVKTMVMSHDDFKNSIIFIAARNESPNVFGLVMSGIEKDITPQELETLLLQRGFQERSLLSNAALHGDRTSFEAVLDAVRTRLTPDQAKTMVMSHDDFNNSILFNAARNKSPNVFRVVMSGIEKDITPQELETLLLQRGFQDRPLLSNAALHGDRTSFEAALNAVRTRLTPDQIKTMVMSPDKFNNSIIHHAAKNKIPNVFGAVMSGIEKDITPQELKTLLLQRGYQGRSLLSTVAREGDRTSFEAVLNAVQTRLTPDQVIEQLTSKMLNGYTLLREAFEIYNAAICRLILQSYQEYTTDEKVVEAIEDCFLSWAERFSEARKKKDWDAVKLFEELLSRMLQHTSRVPPGIFQKLAHDAKDGNIHDWEPFTQLVLEVVESAKNPLVPGMNISIALAAAAERAREGEERKMSALKGTIDSFILEVFERLPQTVRGFKGGIHGCCDLLEPEGKRGGRNIPSGPLQVAFKQRQQMENLCSVPLVMDYISAKFTHGLPDVRDPHGLLSVREDLRLIAEQDDDPIGVSLCIDAEDQNWRSVQGIRLKNEDFPTFTILPGAQFIIAGLVLKPYSYYEVPAMRMAMEFVVYLAMLAAYTQWILLTDDGYVASGEILFAVYILAGGYAEIEELRRDWHNYRQDPWNFLDVLGLIMLFGGFIARLADNELLWGRALYALSAPLMFSRVLFFAQILRFQGPMIEAIFIMGMVIVRFGVILLVVMMSFAVSFFALFRDVHTFDEILLHLFKAMLGDVEYYDDFDDSSRERYATVGQVLLAIFVIVMTIMLLNLLIAILSTTHADVHKNAEREFRISKARTVQYYRLVVEHDILPAPFNLVQLFVSMSFISKVWQRSKSCRLLKRAVGLIVFWLALGPIAVIAGMVLWVVSGIGIPFIIYDAVRSGGNSTEFWLSTGSHFLGSCLGFGFILAVVVSPNEPSMWVPWLVLYVLSIFVPSIYVAVKYESEAVMIRLVWPIFLLWMWLRSPFMWTVEAVEFLIGRQSSQSSTQVNVEPNCCVDVHAMLKDSGTSAKQLRKYLDNPMIDPVVQRDEVDRVTTVKDLKLLRDHFFQEITKNHFEIDGRVSAVRDEINEKLGKTVEIVEGRVAAVRDEINEKLGKIVDILQARHSPYRAGGAVAKGT